MLRVVLFGLLWGNWQLNAGLDSATTVEIEEKLLPKLLSDHEAVFANHKLTVFAKQNHV